MCELDGIEITLVLILVFYTSICIVHRTMYYWMLFDYYQLEYISVCTLCISMYIVY